MSVTVYPDCTPCCGISTVCCPDNPFITELTATITNTTPPASCTVTYDTVNEWWQGFATVTLPCGTRTVGIRVWCSVATNQWRVSVNCNGGAFTPAGGVAGSTVVCDPVFMEFLSVTNPCGPACQPPGTFTIQVTE